MTVITSQEEIVVPQSVRRKAGIKSGDRVEFVPSAGTITIRLKRRARGEYKRAERRAIDRGIAQSQREYRQGKGAGPFSTAQEFLSDLHRENAKLDVKKRKRART